MVEDLSTLKIGDTPNVLVMLKSIINGESANGTYQKLVVRDKFNHEITVFNFGGLSIPDKAPMVMVMGIMVKDYRGEPSYQYVNYKPVDGGKLEDFLPAAKIDYRKAWGEIVKPVNELRTGLKEAVQHVLKKDQALFLAKALTASKGFSRRCGVLEATEKLMHLSISTADTCGLDKDLMVAGAALYFIGHLDMIDGAFNITEDDSLFGPGILAQNKLMAQVSTIPMNEDKVKKDIKLLSHILLSRTRGIQPVIPEAVALKSLSFLVTECDAMQTE